MRAGGRVDVDAAVVIERRCAATARCRFRPTHVGEDVVDDAGVARAADADADAEIVPQGRAVDLEVVALLDAEAGALERRRRRTRRRATSVPRRGQAYRAELRGGRLDRQRTATNGGRAIDSGHRRPGRGGSYRRAAACSRTASMVAGVAADAAAGVAPAQRDGTGDGRRTVGSHAGTPRRRRTRGFTAFRAAGFVPIHRRWPRSTRPRRVLPLYTRAPDVPSRLRAVADRRRAARRCRRLRLRRGGAAAARCSDPDRAGRRCACCSRSG